MSSMADTGRGALSHSHSQPGGMERTPPGTPRKGGKMLAVRVQILDDTVTIFQVQAKALGRVLFDQVCKQLNLLEADYFGLEYQEMGGTRYWLDLEKPLSRQIGLSLVDTLVRFCVKFYTPDPSQLEEEFTRYLFCLQIKRDLAHGLLQCNDNTAALMASYIVQAECGDYVAEDYPDHRYLSSYKFVPNQDQELERRIMENHKKHAGQSPAEADLNLLETARRCELYGVKMHPAKDHEGVPLNLAVAHMGLLVFQNYQKINTFSWAKIRKLSFKRKRFLVKLHPEGYGYYKDTVEFFFEGRNECKNFWKKSVENHGFFRCSQVKRLPRQKTRVLSRGSSFRYSGRTQKQMVEFVRENYVKRQTFQRSQSFRHSSSVHSSVANVGASISAHPLLPLGDNAVAGTPASLSCGSMTLTSSPLHTADIHGTSPSPPLTTSLSPGTSVTSSPQHFYPQETQTRQTGPPHSKVQPPHTTSCQASPNAVSTTTTVASHRSVNPTSIRSPDYSIVNDVYSNSYESIRNLRSEHGELRSKTDTAEGESSEHPWHWSASCKDLAEKKAEREPGEDGENKVYSSSYPGDDSGEMVDSQEDVSHDSYEVLDDACDSRRTRSALSTDNRSRSCSWSSDKALSPIESGPRENGCRSLERRQAAKQHSNDFRSLDRRKAAKTEVKKRRRSKDFDEDGVRRHPERRRSREELEVFMMDSEEELIREEQRRRRRDRRGEREERFHEGIQERERRKQVVADELKYERVVANHFGKYPEFLSQEELLKQERKVIENYEKVCQVGRIAKELEESEKASKETVKPQFKEFNAKTRAGVVVGSPKLSKAPVERTKSDPYDSSSKNLRRNVLTHQKSIDITPQDSGDATSDYDNDEMARKTSKSEHDIPYTLHKRHCMNGTAKSFLAEFSTSTHSKTPLKPVKKSSLDSPRSPRSRSTSPGKRSTPIEIINMDESDGSVIRLVERPPPKPIKPVIGKKPMLPPSPKRDTIESLPGEPVYAKVNKTPKKVPPEPPKRTSSAVKTPEPPPPERTTSLIKSPNGEITKKMPPEPPKRTTSVPKLNGPKSPESDMSLPPTPSGPKNVTNGELPEVPIKPIPAHEEGGKSVLPTLPILPNTVLHKREESLILFARTRLGLSEGSAFAPVTRQGHVTSPTAQRRAKSLDAPVVSLHQLPHADAFSSKDDTLDLEDEITQKSAAAKAAEFFNVQLNKIENQGLQKESLLSDNVAEIDPDFKEIIEIKSKAAIPYPEEKVLDAVRSKRLLSKIDSVDAVESEAESSRAELPEPRISDLPVSVRFPSVRQMSGQTSEESDVWEEVKVKRRTPRRSTGRDEPESKESVVWDSKDEQGDDDVWDDNAVFIPDISTGIEFLKRGSCGQSIDDDNLSTPIKESSPEHWVSVDDLPEAIEREERMLREQDKILREKILHEKLKRELNLDTIEIEDRLFNQNFDDLPLPVMPSEKLKGHSLDTYELAEKKLRERCAVKNPSLDEHIFQDESLRNYLSVSQTLDASDKSSSYENVPKIPKDQQALKPPKSFIECQTVGDVKEIAQFGADDDLEEFVVVLDGDESGTCDANWQDDGSYTRTVSKEESIISVPEEFKDAVEYDADTQTLGPVEIRLEEGMERLLSETEDAEDSGRLSPHDSSRRSSGDPRRLSASDDPGRLSPYDGSRRSSDDPRAQIDDSGRLSPYDTSSRRTSEDPRGMMDDSGRLSPYDCSSRRSSEDPRRLSASDDTDDLRRLSMSEDSRKCSISEDSRRFSTSISEETRRRLSSTEETRRKRASLTKQCSVGVDSLSDDMIPGIQECSSSFEQDDKDVFESGPIIDVDEVGNEQEVPTPSPAEVDSTMDEVLLPDDGNHLVPPKGQRELSRETEDSMDYGEGDFKEIRDVVKDKDISEGLVCEHESVLRLQSKLPSSFEKSESSEADELRFIDDKRGNTPEMIVGRSGTSNVISTVVVNEGMSVLDHIVKDDSNRAKTLPRESSLMDTLAEKRHTLPKTAPKPISSGPDSAHRKLTKVVPNVKLDPCGSLPDVSQDSSQDSDVDRLCAISMLSHIHSQIARRNLSEMGRGLRRDSLTLIPLVTVEQENGKKLTPDEAAEFQKRDSGEEVSSSSSNPPQPRRELSSTWRPFLLESSGSSSLEEGWLPPDDNAHLADEEETSSTSNQQDDSIHDDVIDYPSNVGYTDVADAVDAALLSSTLKDAEKENNNILSSTPLPNGKANGIANNNITRIPSPQNGNISLAVSPETGERTEANAPLAVVDLEPIKRSKRPTSDQAYFIVKELLATERTYHKDLEVLTAYFRDEVSSAPEMPEDVLTVLFSLVDPLAEACSAFLLALELRIEGWDGTTPPGDSLSKDRVGDILLQLFNVLPHYEKYVDKHLLVLERLDAAFRKNKKFELLYREFELQRVCHLPLSCFLVKPLQRLLHYDKLLDRLIRHYGMEHVDLPDCTSAKEKLKRIVDSIPQVLEVTENFVQLSELQRDMPTFEGLVQGGREFIRQGCLSKHSRKGFQQRMFFLFSDILVYTNRSTSPTLQFKVHGQMPLRGVMVDEKDTRTGVPFAFTIFGGNRTLALGASSQEEKDKWLEDLYDAINVARERNDGKLLQYLSLKSSSSSEECMEGVGQDPLTRERSAAHRSNTTVHVCWHRSTSTSLKDHVRARSNELSGFLLRKFKNSNGWQKLWVVFTHFCLFFYKTYLEDSPLASLPLLGYTVTVPSEEDDIHKDFVFKLQYKNHVYFFRAESGYTFSRWMEVINSVTHHPGRIRLFSRKESSLSNNHV